MPWGRPRALSGPLCSFEPETEEISMNVDLIFRIAAIGILVSVLNQVL